MRTVELLASLQAPGLFLPWNCPLLDILPLFPWLSASLCPISYSGAKEPGIPAGPCLTLTPACNRPLWEAKDAAKLSTMYTTVPMERNSIQMSALQRLRRNSSRAWSVSFWDCHIESVGLGTLEIKRTAHRLSASAWEERLHLDFWAKALNKWMRGRLLAAVTRRHRLINKPALLLSKLLYRIVLIPFLNWALRRLKQHSDCDCFLHNLATTRKCWVSVFSSFPRSQISVLPNTK